jgi:hypothetical protein
MLFWVKHYIKVKKKLFEIWGLWVSKEAEFNVDLKNIKLISVTKCT